MDHEIKIARKIISRWYIMPSMAYLLLVLISGILIRLQWVSPGLIPFNTKYLIHAHSHLAILGWLFIIIAGVFTIRFVKYTPINPLYSRWLPLLMHINIVLMTYSYLIEGYAFNSITLSTTFIILMTIWSVLFFKHSGHVCKAPISILMAKATIVILLISNIAPIALSAGMFMGEEWIRTWVSFYLHFQFSGWIPLAILAILVQESHLDLNTKRNRWMICLFITGSILLFEPIIRTGNEIQSLELIGMLGGLLIVYTSAFYTKNLLFHNSTNNSLSIWQRIFIITGLIGIFLKAVFQLIGSLPVIGVEFISNHFLVIGFTHLLLLGAYTPILLSQVSSLPLTKSTTLHLVKPPANQNVTPAIAALLFVIGCISMIGFLFYLGSLQLLGSITDLPVQKILMHSGFLILIGFLLFMAVIHKQVATD